MGMRPSSALLRALLVSAGPHSTSSASLPLDTRFSIGSGPISLKRVLPVELMDEIAPPAFASLPFLALDRQQGMTETGDVVHLCFPVSSGVVVADLVIALAWTDPPASIVAKKIVV